MHHRSTDFQGLDNPIRSRGMASSQWRFLVIATICATGIITNSSRTALAQRAGRDVGARCSVSSDCMSGVCHPATHLCMVSAAAAQPASPSYGANQHSGPALCSAPNDQCTPKASIGGVGASCRVNSDCMSGVCHPVTQLCMLSAAAAQPSAASCNVASYCDSDGVQYRRPGTVGASN
jgi:hypothetical protein